MVNKNFLFVGTFLWPLLVNGQHFIDVTTSNLPEIVRGSYNSMSATAGDVDGDGDLDIVVGVEFRKNVILINDGTGRFVDESFRLPDLKAKIEPKPYPFYPYHDTEDIALADFDRDGDPDLVFVSEDDQTNEFYLNNGKGFFSDYSDTFPVKGTSNAVIARDFDGDGFLDLMIGNNGQNFYVRNRDGQWKDETSARLPLSEDITQDLEPYDLDDDGDIDVVVANELDNKILINNGKGYFSDETSRYINPEFQVSGETRKAKVGDLNGDGRPDIFFANVFMFQKMAPVQRLLVNSQKGFTDQTKSRLGIIDEHSFPDVDFVDLNNDSFLDIVGTTYEGAKIFLNNGKGYFSDVTKSFLGDTKGLGVKVLTADFDSDGKQDIYVANFRGSDVLYLQRQ